METEKNGVRRTEIGGDEPTNGGRATTKRMEPYIATVKLRGVSDILYHRFVINPIESGKGSNKTDDLEGYVYRNEEGFICLPGEMVRGAVANAAKFRKDPRSPRKSLHDLAKAVIIPLTPLASHGIKVWDYEHVSPVVIQRSRIVRTRPALKSGWEAEVQLLCNMPQYINPNLLHELLNMAGQLVGLADFRPTYGRFVVASFDVGFTE